MTAARLVLSAANRPAANPEPRLAFNHHRRRCMLAVRLDLIADCYDG
jgi:hypothetical protein